MTSPAPLATIATIALTCAVLTSAGCGSNGTKTDKTATTSKTARAIDAAPLTFTVSGATITITADAKAGAPTSDEPARVVCANLAANGFADRDETRTTWKQGSLSATATLPKPATDRDLCAISFTETKKQFVAFFDKQAQARYIADRKASK